MTEAYDPNVCYLTFVEENYLFVLERSQGNCDASNSQRCSWDLQNDAKVARAIPSSFSGPQTYFCDGSYRPLAWADDHGDAGSPPPDGSSAPPPLNGSSTPPSGSGASPDGLGSAPPISVEGSTSSNGYQCVCGGPIENDTLTHGRTDRPWKGAFGKRCNVITNFPLSKGDFGSTYDASQGVCATMAGQSNNASLVVQGSFPYPENGLTTIDKYGVLYYCNDSPAGPDVMGKPVEQVCNCDGPLPETVFGQRLTSQQRDRCGLESAKKMRTGIIAGSVVGGLLAVGLVLALVAILFLRRRRTRSKRRSRSFGSDDDKHSMGSDVELRDKSPQRVYYSI